jgi:hypothetical protein
MDYLYSLYDALVSINVPGDKARAVVDAMERDMENRFALVDQRFESLRSDLSRDITTSELKLTVKLGSMMVAGFGLTIAAMRAWI